MRTIINKSDRTILYRSEPTYLIKGKEESEFYIWGTIYIIKEDAFDVSTLCQLLLSSSFEDVVPLLTGTYCIVQIRSNTIEKIAVDFYGHKRLYLYETDENYFIFDDVNEVELVSDEELDLFQIRHFIDKGYTWSGGTFYKRLKIIAPSICYEFNNSGYSTSYLSFPTFELKGNCIDDAMENVISALASKCKKISLMFSSGIDSSFIREIAYQSKNKIDSIICDIQKPRLWVTEEDNQMASAINLGRKDIVTAPLKNVYDLMDDSFDETIHLLPFEFHISVFQMYLAKFSKENDYDIVITGQNADSVYNYGCTAYMPLLDSVKRLLKGHIHRAGITIWFKRFLQTTRFLDSLVQNRVNPLIKIIWNKINPNFPLSFENVLLSFLVSDNALPIIEQNKIEAYDGIYISEYRRQIKELTGLLKNGETPRQILIRSKLLGHCQGRDVRCITEWSRKLGISNMQVFTSAPVINYLGQKKFTLKDVIVPKRELRDYLNEKISYEKVKKNLILHSNDDDCIRSESEYFRTIFESLNKDGSFMKSLNKSIEFLLNKKIISESELSKGYTDNWFRYVWFIRSIENFKVKK